MPHGWMLFSFDGRLNRQPYWIATVELTLAAIVVAGGVAAAFHAMGKASTAQELLRVAHPWLTGFGFILAYPAAAVFAKRLHDRNKTGWLAALLIVPMLIETVLDPAGGVTQTELVHWVYQATSAMTLLVALWFLIELGCLRGTDGDNRYGPDPLAVAPAEQVRGIAP
jgi:uncharacterized membrane protein YhaH (DUF805 family)